MFELVAQSLVSGIAIGCVYGLIGIGFCVIYNASGIVNFAQGAFVMLGGMVTYVGLTRYGLPLPVAAVIAMAGVETFARDLLNKVGLDAHADTLAGVLPYGQKRLLEIARALAAEPKLLMLDEPAAGLNRGETTRLADLIRRIVTLGVTVLLIEHDMSFVMNIADRLAVLDFGKLIASGTPAEVQRNPDVIAAYLGTMEAAHA